MKNEKLHQPRQLQLPSEECFSLMKSGPSRTVSLHVLGSHPAFH